MNFSPFKPYATRLSFDADSSMQVELTGYSLIIPLVYFSQLLNASLSQRENSIMSGSGSELH